VDSDPPANIWSTCSTEDLAKSYNKGMDYCLHNIPETLHGDTPECGNGIVEQGEDCDCANADESVR